MPVLGFIEIQNHGDRRKNLENQLIQAVDLNDDGLADYSELNVVCYTLNIPLNQELEELSNDEIETYLNLNVYSQ